jgi:hypothetical protein
MTAKSKRRTKEQPVKANGTRRYATACQAKRHNPEGKSDKAWNNMSHLSLKRFDDNDPTLTDGAKRNRASNPHVAVAEVDPSGRSRCKLCGSIIPKGVLRFGLMLECHKGYRMLCTLHEECFWEHPESRKLESAEEIFVRPNVNELQKKAIEEDFISKRTAC